MAKRGGLPLFISPSGVQRGVTQCDGCSPDPQTPADTFNGHRFLSRQREKEREGQGGWREGDRGGGIDFQRPKRRWKKKKVGRKSENTPERERGKNKVSEGETKGEFYGRWTSGAR